MCNYDLQSAESFSWKKKPGMIDPGMVVVVVIVVI